MLKPIHQPTLTEALKRPQIYFSTEAAHHKHSINGLSKLVTEQTGQAPEINAAYIFAVNGSRNVKILFPDEKMNSVMEIQGKNAEDLIRECMSA